VFDSLTADQIRLIVDVQLKRIAKHMSEQEIGLEVTDAAKDLLAKEGFDTEFGARPLKRAIQKHVQNLLADAILTSKVAPGDTAVVDVSNGKFWLTARKAEPKPEPSTVGA
jgi:ATP-dependent Clp protease ATP-binding subunit ClpA